LRDESAAWAPEADKVLDRQPVPTVSDLSVKGERQRETDRLERELAALPPRGQWGPTADYGDG